MKRSNLTIHRGQDYVAIIQRRKPHREVVVIRYPSKADIALAKRFAAAPAMLAALKRARPYVDRRADPEVNPDSTTQDRACLQEIDVAIDEAEGRS